MTVYVIVEGDLDKKVLEAAFRFDGPDDINIVAANGKESAVKLAASIMMNRNAPTAVVLDADTENDILVEEQRRGYQQLLHTFRNAADFRVFFFVPDLEQALFRRGEYLSAISRTGGVVQNGTLKQILQSTLKNPDNNVQKKLAQGLMRNDVIKELNSFVRQKQGDLQQV